MYRQAKMPKLQIVSIVALLLTLGGQSLAEEIIVLTGGTSGVYYPVGLALKKIFEREIPDAKVTVLATQATVENLNLLQQGKGTIALAQGDILSEAWKGNPEAGFPSSRTKIRLIGAAYPNYIHIIARRDSGIARLQDLRGKRVSVGAARSGNELNARALLSSADMSYADLLQVEYLEYGQSVELMFKGQLDAAIISAGLGVAAVNRAVAEIPIVFVPVPSDLVEKNKGMFFSIPIPAKSYATQELEVPTAGLNNFFVTSSDVPEPAIHRLTQAIFGNIGDVKAAHPAASVISAEKALIVRPIDVHPGAVRYFRDAGLIR